METAAYTGKLAVSLAGHDKNQIFFILKEEGEYVYLVDGRIRTIDHPKKKKKRHMKLMEEFTTPGIGNRRIETDKNAEQMTDCEIKYLLKCYKRQVVRR